MDSQDQEVVIGGVLLTFELTDLFLGPHVGANRTIRRRRLRLAVTLLELFRSASRYPSIISFMDRLQFDYWFRRSSFYCVDASAC